MRKHYGTQNMQTLQKDAKARYTPHMYVIDGDGMLRFMGGIDDKPSSRHETVATATNYVRAALADLAAGRQVAQAVTRPYGCNIKYAD